MSAGYFWPIARSGLDCFERSERRPVTIPALTIRTTVPTDLPWPQGGGFGSELAMVARLCVLRLQERGRCVMWRAFKVAWALMGQAMRRLTVASL